MSDISSIAYHQCHWVLQQCSEFDSNDSLRAFFAAPALRFLQNTLPQADDKEARVMKAMSFLVQKRDKDGTLALVIFVNELLQHKSFEEDLYHQLKNLEDQIQRDLASHELLEIPVVVAAMNQSQAARLLMGDVFEDSGLKMHRFLASVLRNLRNTSKITLLLCYPHTDLIVKIGRYL